MGITIVQHSNLKQKKPKAAKALVLAGGAVTGGSFMTGGIKALNDYFANFSVNEFDIYVGISSGSLIAAPLIGGVRPETILRSLDGTSTRFGQLTSWHFYRPNFEELLARPLAFAVRVLSWLPLTMRHLFRTRETWIRRFVEDSVGFLKAPSLAKYDALLKHALEHFEAIDFPALMSLVPTGAFDNRPIEHYLRENIQRNNLTNSFSETQRITKKRLYICAIELDGARPVIFGPDERDELTISEAVMASTALPGFYRPARIRGVDYVDGMVHETANIDIAVKKGARLIVCYNPFKPYEPAQFMDNIQRERDLLSRTGIFAVMYQIVRAAVYSRLKLSLDHYRSDPNFKGDIILIEPNATDADFSSLNPLLLSNRVRAAWLGYTSVRNSIENRFEEIQRIMKSYGIAMARPKVEEEFVTNEGIKKSPSRVQDWLEGRLKNSET